MIIVIILVIVICVVQLHSLLGTLEMQTSRGRSGHFALFNCWILGHTKYNGVQRIYCDPFPNKKFYGAHRMDLVFVCPPGVQARGFVMTPDSVWYFVVC